MRKHFGQGYCSKGTIRDNHFNSIRQKINIFVSMQDEKK